VKNIIAVASGKGRRRQEHHRGQPGAGAGRRGRQVGMLDADIYGPSQPMMLGIEGRPESRDGKTIEPMENTACRPCRSAS
jgi:ATP-binding protein involved in chromosome partitioning